MQVRIEIDVNGDAGGLRQVVEELLDFGTIQDAINDGCSDHGVKAEIESISSSEVE